MMLYVIGLLAAPTILHACSSLPPGHEREMVILVEDMTLPMEFTYSETMNVTEQYPLVQTTSKNAVTNLQKYVKTAVSIAIKKIAEESGYGGFVKEIGKQITTKVYYYPLLCYAMEVKPTSGVPMPTYFSGIGYFCLSKNDSVAKVLYDIKGVYVADIPQQHQDFLIILKIRNFVVSTWSRFIWEIAMLKVQNRLKKGVYGTYFKKAQVSII